MFGKYQIRLSVIGVGIGLALLSGCADVNPKQPNIAEGGRAVSVSVKPGDSTNIIVASESGGLFRTTNRGTDWAQVSGATSFSYADVLYAPNQSGTIVAAAQGDMRTTSGGGIWRSTDGGTNWNRMTMTPPTADCAANLAAYSLSAETNPSRLWTGTLCGLAYSTDAGGTWQYLPAATGYNNDKVYAVVTPGNGHLKILTDAGVKTSTNDGTSWSSSSAGLPGNMVIGVHNQIAASPLNDKHLYWAFNYWHWNGSSNQWEGHRALYRSLDDGNSWSSVIDAGGINRPPFVKVSGPTSSNTYELYFSDGSCALERASVTNGATPSISSWTSAGLDHCDPADLGFDTDNHTPLLLASDGGVHLTPDGGANWKLTGAAGHGYAALQVTEVTGQQQGSSSGLYFGTQDNNIWASPDDGTTWSASRCCEGFFLNIWPTSLAPTDTKFTGVSCGACGNFMSGPVLAAQGGFPDPPNNAGNPRLLKPGYYVQNTSITGVTDSVFDLTSDNGASWAPRYGFPEQVRDLSKIAGDSSDPIVYTAVRYPGSTSDGQEIVGIKRIVGVTDSGAPVLSDVNGFGSLGIFATMFAWYKPFGIDPNDPNHFIVPDIVDNVVKVSSDGGATWQPDNNLTGLITQSGNMKFRSGPFTQLTSFGFDPACAGHILVGTLEAGIFQTFDNGVSWAKVKGSEIVPNVSSFFFHKAGQAVASSYGRGLWTVNYKCTVVPRRPSVIIVAEPLIYWKGAYIPISQIHNPDACPVCTWVLVDGGTIVDYVVNEKQQIQQVQLSSGTLSAFTWDGVQTKVAFPSSTGQQLGSFSGEKQLTRRLREGKLQVRGLLVEKNLLKGVILSSQEVTAAQIPQKQKEQKPRIEVFTAVRGAVGVPVGSSAPLSIRGHHFEAGTPIEILVDGHPVETESKVRVDKSGEFTTSIHPIFNIGGHTVLVRQKTAHGVIQDAYTFNVTVTDSPR